LCKQNANTLLVVNVSTERLCGRGIIIYRTDLLGKCGPRCPVTSFFQRKIK